MCGRIVAEPGRVGEEAAAPLAKATASVGDGSAGLKGGDPYAILGVARTASAGEVRAAYLRLVKELHPDGRANGSAVPDDADERLRLINDAYRELKEADKRATARRAEVRRRGRRASALFVAGVMTSVAPVAVVLVAGAYYAGWLGAPASPTTAAPGGTDPRDPGVAVTGYTKKTDVERRIAWSEARKETAVAAEARRNAEAKAWAATETEGSREGLERFIAAYPDGAHAVEARQALAALAARQTRQDADQAAWILANRSGAKAALHQYLADYPDGSFVAEARERVAFLEAEDNAKDDAAWLKAARRHNKAAYAGYLAAYPAGRRATDARLRLAELERSEARRRGP